ncbi:MAG TPA: hypothetical protein VK961_06115 [Chthoniobacter sp.]|nr:hypothetical protein [Chthoniobacter sp.]
MNRPIPFRIAALCGAALALSVTACKKPQIRVYTVSKDLPEAPAPTSTPGLRLSDAKANPAAKPEAESAPRPRPQLDYLLPPGWQDSGASQFSLVNFRIPTPKGDAMVNITPLAGMSGRDTVIVNMWRQQLGEDPMEDAAAAESLKPVEIGGEQGKLFEVTGKRDGQDLQIVTAFVHRADGSWFYKLQGPAEAVALQKETFINFLKTVKVKPGTAATAEAKPPAEALPSEPAPAAHIVAPEGWQEVPPGQMVVAKFAVNKEGGKADVSVSVFPSDTGGTLENVNRWRRQMGMEPVDENGLQECITSLGSGIDGAPGPVLADLSKDNRRLLGAIVPREGKWWFYKMFGDASVVNAEHDTFVQFVKSQP